MLVWSLILGFAGDVKTRSITAFQRTYQTATNQTIVRSSFYDRFIPELRDHLTRARGGRGPLHDRTATHPVP